MNVNNYLECNDWHQVIEKKSVSFATCQIEETKHYPIIYYYNISVNPR